MSRQTLTKDAFRATLARHGITPPEADLAAAFSQLCRLRAESQAQDTSSEADNAAD